MPTIKTKKEMNLPELIEYIAETEYKAENYTSNDNGAVVGVGLLKGIFINGTIFPNHTFTVEIEEEITEDTVFDKLISRYVFLSSKPSYAHSINTSIKEVVEYRKVATHIYLENEDNELQLIWTKEKGLVE